MLQSSVEIDEIVFCYNIALSVAIAVSAILWRLAFT